MNQLCAGVIIGLFSWGAQESQSIAVTIVKSGTAAAFLNVGLIFSLLVDITYFKREAFWTDYAGAGMILLCTSFQAWVSTQQYDDQLELEVQRAKEQLLIGKQNEDGFFSTK